MEYQGRVSNEAEFEDWLALAFERESKRLRDHTAARDVRDSRLKVVPDRTIIAERKKDTLPPREPLGGTL